MACDRFLANEDAEATERVADFRVQAERLRAVGRSRFDALYQLSESGREGSWTFPAALVTRSTPRRSQTNMASRPLGCGDWLSAIAQETTLLPERAVIGCLGPTDIAQRARACRKANLLAGAATVLCVTCGLLGAPFRGPVDVALFGVAFLAALFVGLVLIFVVFEIGARATATRHTNTTATNSTDRGMGFRSTRLKSDPTNARPSSSSSDGRNTCPMGCCEGRTAGRS